MKEKSMMEAHRLSDVRVRARICKHVRRATSIRQSTAISLVLALALLAQSVIPPISAAHEGRKSFSSRSKPVKSSSGFRSNRRIAPQETAVEAATVRHLGNLNGRIEGSVRQLIAENVTLNSSAVITSALLIPGTPEVRLNGNPNFGGTVQGTGNAEPSTHRVTLNSNSTLGRLVTRVDPVSLPTVAHPPASTGTRDVSINNANQSIGDPATLRDLTLNGNAGNVTVPPGTYRNFTANGNSSFVFGVAGSSEPTVYNLNQLSLNGNAKLTVSGPIVLTVASNVTLNGSAGASLDPLWLTMKIATGSLTLNGGASLYGVVQAPSGTVTINGNSLLQGSVACDRLTVNGNGILKGTPGALAAVSPTSAVQGQTMTVALRGVNTHWINGQTRASFGGEISVGGAAEGEAGSVQVLDSLNAVASIVVSTTAALAPSTVRVITPVAGFSEGAIEVLIDAFTVTANPAPGSATAAVSTLAGTGVAGFADGSSAQAQFRNPSAIAAGPAETIYVADSGNHSIRRIGADALVTTLAGNGTAGFADGQGTAARFNNPQGVAVDASGVVYVADTANHRIRRIATDGAVTTIAGDGIAGLQNGTGAGARFNSPQGIATDNTGGLYIADTGNNVVRYLSSSGDVSTVAGDGSTGSTDSPARFNNPAGVAFDGETLYVFLADSGNHRIRRLNQSGNVVTIAGGGRGFADGSASQARFADPSGIAIDGAGKLIIADATNSLVRMIDVERAITGAASAVTTIAGTGARGLTSGTGSAARFFTPRSVVVMLSSAMIIADTGNHSIRKVTLPPAIDSLNPPQSFVEQTILIDGERFDGRDPSRNTVVFVRSALAGGGTTQAQVVTATRTQLTVVVPSDAATGNVTVQTEGGTAISAAAFTVLVPPPLITDFNPKRGPVGTEVTISGANLTSGAGLPAVTFAGANGLRLNALVNSANANEVRVTVPNAAVTGVIQLTNTNGTASTAQSFTVEGGPLDYQLTLAPSATTAVRRTSATYIVYATGSSTSFSQLIALSVSGLPAGATAIVEPQQITSGASATLTVDLSSGDLAAGSYSFAVRGSAPVDGSEMIRTAAGTLNVLASGQTTLSGRVLSTEGEPVIGATASLDGKSATTDAAGNFLLTAVNAGTDRALMIDGRTASAPNRTYPIITEPVTIVAGQANVNPYTFYLPVIDTEHEVTVIPNQETVVATPQVPGVKVTIPAGANLRNRDGSPVTRVSITPVPIDRTPAPLPADVSPSLVFTIQPGGALSDLPIPVTYPNLGGADAGTRVELYAFNHDTVRWEVYGFGRVSADGRLIEPEIDPSTGRPYGLRTFAWYFTSIIETSPETDAERNPAEDDDFPCGNKTTNTVDLASGNKIETMVDLAFGGARGGVILGRIFTNAMSRLNVVGRFGNGWKDSYDIRLTGSFEEGGSGRMMMPDQVDGRLFSYERKESDGTLVFTTQATIAQMGDELKNLVNGTFEYRFADGSVLRFDSNGRLTEMSDTNSNTTRLEYGGANLTRITDAVGRSVVLDYDSSNRIIKATDPIGREWKYEYSVNTLVKVKDPLNQEINYIYATEGVLVVVRDKRGNEAKRLDYDSDGRVTRQRFALGKFEEYRYTLSGRVVTGVEIIDSLGRKMKRRFNASGRTIETTDSLGQVSKIEREIATGLPTMMTGPCGCGEAVKKFDERGNITEVTDRLGQRIRMEYEPVFNQMTRITDKLGRETRFEYDSRGNLTRITDALNQVMRMEYDQQGQMLSVTDELNHAGRMEYDNQGNVTATVDALGNRETVEYDAIGRATGAEDALGRRVTMSYDALSRVIALTDPAGARTTFVYDENGNLTKTTNQLGHEMTRTYDARNRVRSATDGESNTGQVEYDSEDQVTALVTPLGRRVSYEYDKRGQVETITDPMSGEVRLTYNNRRNLVALTDKRGYTTTWSYDELFRPVSVRDPLGRESRVSYDGMDNAVESIDRLGRRAVMSYDALHRLTRAVYEDATVTYSYDTASRMTRIEDSQSGFVEWSYDDADRLLSETTPNGMVSYAYNTASQIIRMTAADRLPVNYGYDTAGRLETITQSGETFRYGYDEISRMTSLQRPNALTTLYFYDRNSRLTSLLHRNGANQTIEQMLYSYNADSQIETMTSQATIPMVPEAANATTADEANRIAQIGVSSFTFDQEGQTTKKTDATGETVYNWDARGRLRSVNLPNGQSVSYGYDALGRRASRTAQGETTAFVYDGPDVVMDRAGGNTIAEYTNGPGIDDKLRQTTASTSLYFLQDHLGSTIALIDTTGSTVERQHYDPFGASAGSSLTRYGYTGREKDADTGLIYYRARWYDARQGRFITEDPIGMAGGLNLYSYVENDPVGLTDPFGLRPLPPRPPGWEDSKLVDILEFMHDLQDDDEFGTRYVDPLNGDGPEGIEWIREQAGDDPCAEWEWDAGVSEGSFVRGIGFLRKLVKWGKRGVKWGRRLNPRAIARARRIARIRQARAVARPVADSIRNWLGPDARVITNQSGDKIFLSRDGLRRVRFDINRPHPHRNPHGHVEEFINGRWQTSGPIYPKDVPPF